METLEQPQMPVLRESPDEIYQRIVNRALAYAEAKGQTPPATEEGEVFYDFWYPLAEEIADQQLLLEYAFLQGFVVWADGEFLEAHGIAEGVEKKIGESDEDYRKRIIDKKRTTEGNGRTEDYVSWALALDGVGGAVAVEHERSDVSVDLYLVDLDGVPVTSEFAGRIRGLLEKKRVAGHDLQCHSADIFDIEVKVRLSMADDTKRDQTILLLKKRIQDYVRKRNTIVYQKMGALFWIDGITDYADYTLNGGTSNITKPQKAVFHVILEVLT
ncbi:baseplate J/gp47 family protein [Brevibacillus laterosporus]|uniref:baseplate J/gp47 family protein n=1 Tax=Brevibacillus laterosporus TaxID=1465 RepID=UPI0003B1BA21|nr:baseplate J/gp47 family protein [Brevibacillus laterosporus]ERM19083.1 hypothetical protein P615_13705 [Brevibacillus laterosporus PE36]